MRLICLSIFASVSLVYAAGPHEGLDCLGCHDPHYAKAQKIFKVLNTEYPNPRTGDKVKGISALCLGCHNLVQFGGAGIKPVFLHMTHPVGVKPNPRIAQVPEKLLRDGVLQCVSCHDPHPSNPAWKYLRVDTKGGSQVGKFCAVCHPAKVDLKFYKVRKENIKLFSSMNEEAGSGFFSVEDPQFTIANPTPAYIKPFGSYENSLSPAYTFVPNKTWIFNPPKNNLPKELLTLIGEEEKIQPGQ